MATTGAQPGNKNATKAKPWSEAIRKALLANDGVKLRELADKVVEMALAGDMQAIREVGDRFEGKVPQGLEHTGADGGELVIRDATTSLGLARRVAYVLAQGAITKAKGTAEAAGDKQAEKKEA